PPHGLRLFLSMMRPRPRSTLFPYTTLFRSAVADGLGVAANRRQRRAQIVRDRQQELLLEVLRALQLGGHGVDRAHEIRQLVGSRDRKSTRLNSSHVAISYAVCCSKQKKTAS